MTRRARPQQTSALLRVLTAGKVEFVVVGGVAAIVHGSARMTSDLDLAMPFTRPNLERFIDAMRPYQPMHATRPDLSLLNEPIERLIGFRMLLVETDLGRVDAMPNVIPLGPYEALDTVERELFGEEYRILSIDALIRVKLHLARPKDLEVAYELKAIQDRQRGARPKKG